MNGFEKQKNQIVSSCSLSKNKANKAVEATPIGEPHLCDSKPKATNMMTIVNPSSKVIGNSRRLFDFYLLMKKAGVKNRSRNVKVSDNARFFVFNVFIQMLNSERAISRDKFFIEVVFRDDSCILLADLDRIRSSGVHVNGYENAIRFFDCLPKSHCGLLSECGLWLGLDDLVDLFH